MKRFVSLFILILLFCSCGYETNTKIKPSLPLTITAKQRENGSDFTARIDQNECEIILGENHSLSGTRLYFSSNGNKAEIGNFSRDIKSGTFPAFETFFKAIQTICNNDITALKTENGEKYTIDEMTIMVYYDKDTEQIIGIGTEESGQSFYFDIVSLRPSDEI